MSPQHPSQHDLNNFTELGEKIIGIGKSYDYNWPDLKKGDPLPEPLVFVKPTSSYTSTDKVIEIPRGCSIVHEVEIAVVIGKGGRDISVDDAMGHVGGYALALDLCAKNVQAEAAKRGYPWAICKGLDTFTPIGRFLPKDRIRDPHDVVLDLKINGETRQHGSTSGLIYTIPQLISYISGAFTLSPGDVILTGTPLGVSAFYEGDKLVATMTLPDGTVLDTLSLDAVPRPAGFRAAGYWLERS